MFQLKKRYNAQYIFLLKLFYALAYTILNNLGTLGLDQIRSAHVKKIYLNLTIYLANSIVITKKLYILRSTISGSLLINYNTLEVWCSRRNLYVYHINKASHVF